MKNGLCRSRPPEAFCVSGRVTSSSKTKCRRAACMARTVLCSPARLRHRTGASQWNAATNLPLSRFYISCAYPQIRTPLIGAVRLRVGRRCSSVLLTSAKECSLFAHEVPPYGNLARSPTGCVWVQIHIYIRRHVRVRV